MEVKSLILDEILSPLSCRRQRLFSWHLERRVDARGRTSAMTSIELEEFPKAIDRLLARR